MEGRDRIVQRCSSFFCFVLSGATPPPACISVSPFAPAPGILFCEFIHFVLAMAFEWDGQPLWFAVQQHMICMAIVLHCEARHGGAQQICHIVRHGGVATSA